MLKIRFTKELWEYIKTKRLEFGGISPIGTVLRLLEDCMKRDQENKDQQ